jgi:protein-tyrosine kinase
MSRVDEALRRAAEETGNTVTVGADEMSGSLGDVEELSQEPYPIEMIDWRRRPHDNAATVATSAPAPPRPGSLGQPTPTAATTLFERVNASLAEKTTVDANMSPSAREQYRRLAAALHHRQETSGLKVVMVTSALVGEGKTLTAANLALTLSESYKKSVLLIDADLRRPALQTIFSVETGPGLSEGLTAIDNRRLPVHQVAPHLAILSAGKPISDPIAALTCDRMRQLLEEARASFEWVIIDTPPVAMLPDANLLGAMVDGAILIIRAGTTSYQAVQRAVDAIGNGKILGSVLNRATRHGTEAGDDYYYQYYKPTPGANGSS